MDPTAFDTLTRTLTTAGSRRRALAGVLLGSLGLLDRQRGEDAAAHDLKATCKKKSGKAKKKCLKKAKKHAAQHAAEPSPPPPPPPPISCLDPARPNVCASTNACLPACAPDKAFDPATCRCRCLDRLDCCECLDGAAVDLCLEIPPPSGNAENCQNFCEGQGLTASRFVSGGRVECSGPGEGTCTTICSDDP